MASSGSVFSETLQNITDTKLEELSVRREDFESSKSATISSLDNEKDPIKRVQTLVKGIKTCFGIRVDSQGKVYRNSGGNNNIKARLEVDLGNLDRFLAQARYDPSVSAKVLARWETSLLSYLDTQSLKFQYADLYGQLVTEWLGEDKREKASGQPGAEQGFQDVGNARKLEARMNWEKHVFQPAHVDRPRLKTYLSELFGLEDPEKNGDILKALTYLRNRICTFEIAMSAPDQFNQDTLGWTIRGLLASDLLPNEQREVLKDFQGNDIILEEIADVLNMRMGALSSWSWGPEVAVEQRRKISGIYDITMQEDLLQAIFLQYIGVKWSVFMKHSLKGFVDSNGAWNPMGKPIPPVDEQRIRYYRRNFRTAGSLQEFRQSIYQDGYFLARLRNTFDQLDSSAEGEEEAEYSTPEPSKRARKAKMPQQMPQQMAMRSEQKESYDDDGDRDFFKAANAMQRKQNLLRLLSTEVVLHTAVHEEVTAFHTVFETWNPLLPHETILDVLEFFGVSETWRTFFRTFLRAPLKFSDDDDSVAPRPRQRGTPAAHALSDFFGESVLFCLDFAVNHATPGKRIWRIYDDLWFWSPDHEEAVAAWRTVERFATVTGTTLNTSKTGSVRISGNPDVTLSCGKSLPEGDIRWGFLRLSPSTGRFDIDQTMVDKHIEELRTQLHGTKSVLSFIQAWNSYAGTFFSSNFGKPANCYGLEHVDSMLQTHQRIQKEVFAKSFMDSAASSSTLPDNVVDHLKQTIHSRFSVPDVPDGYIFFPVELGGLDLRSPFVTLLQIRDSVLQSPSKAMADYSKQEHEQYSRDRDDFLRWRQGSSRGKTQYWEPQSQLDKENFMSFEEYVRYREETSLRRDVKDVYKKLLETPHEVPVEADSVVIEAALQGLGPGSGIKRARSSNGNEAGAITWNWYEMEPYWKWVAGMYGPEIVERFGGLRIVDVGLLPMGMVKMFREKRLKWEV